MTFSLRGVRIVNRDLTLTFEGDEPPAMAGRGSFQREYRIMLFKQNTPATKSGDSLPPIKSADSASAGKLPLPPAFAERAMGTPAPGSLSAPASPSPASTFDDGETGKRLIVGKGIQLKARNSTASIARARNERSPPATGWSWRARSRSP